MSAFSLSGFSAKYKATILSYPNTISYKYKNVIAFHQICIKCISDMKPRNLADVSKEEQSNFFKSFDHVFLDMDGVIWVGTGTLPASVDCIDTLKQRGKKVRYVTNNPLATSENLWKKLIREGFNAEVDDVANPITSVIAYLKEINFNKKLFVVGSKGLKDELRRANFNLAPDPPQVIDDTLTAVLSNITDDEDIGAIIFSCDINLTYIKLQKILTYLKRSDCLFLVLVTDRDGPIGELGPIIGNEHFIRLVEDFSGRESIFVGKPSAYLVEFIKNKFGVTDRKRVLFIGDQIDPDMRFANMGGFQKLLVLTGMTQIEDINDWQQPEEYKPEYYVEGLDDLYKILKSTK